MPSIAYERLTPEVFAVGNFVAVTGSVAALPTRLTLIDPDYVGFVTLGGSRTNVVIEAVWETGASGAIREEAIRMACRIVQKRWPDAAMKLVVEGRGDWLREDGFEPTDINTFSRDTGPFELVALRSERTYKVYDHVLDVHWNYVPAEVEAYQDLLGEPPLRVLDIGAGVGKNARVLATAGHSVTALEASTWASRRMRDFMPDVISVISSVTSLPFEDGTFDVVVDIGCLHCIPEYERSIAVSEVARVLSPGGRLISRMFKPRDQAWIARQPFLAETFGMTEAEVLELLSSSFSKVEWSQLDPNMHYVTAWSAR